MDMTALRSSVPDTLATPVDEVRLTLGLFGPRAWLMAAGAAAAALVLIGVPADLIDTQWFVRMIPARPQDYVIWAASAVLVGLIAGTFTLPAPEGDEGKTLSGGALTYLAVGCPICNKLIIMLLGVSGALTFFAPVQLYLGLASLGLLAWTLRLRARTVVGACALPSEV
jgi:hypothetical protein